MKQKYATSVRRNCEIINQDLGGCSSAVAYLKAMFLCLGYDVGYNIGILNMIFHLVQ
jgi:hypothetical protein